VAGAEGLLERDAELAFVGRLIRDALQGTGCVLGIEGSAGIGKTAFLAAASARAEATGVRVLSAQGGELEGDLAFGVVRQLFERAVVRASGAEQEAVLSGAAQLAAPALLLGRPAAGDPAGALHGLYWLAANLAEREPLALVVDDLHWADPDSLRWLGYLARRVDDLPLAVLLALRSGKPGDHASLLETLVGGRTVKRLALRPLTEAAGAQLIRRALRRDADSAFCRACHAATGGNPFYLGELVTTIRDERLEPTTENAVHVPQLAPATAARSILLRLGRLGKDAVDLAHAIAVLGPDAELRHAAALARLDAEAAQLAADELVAVELVRSGEPLEFAHPIVAASVVGDIKPGARSISHKRAARLLASRQSPPDSVALHLVSTMPEGDPWVVERLVEAAEWSVERAAPVAAARFLRRALDEPPSRDRRADVLFELGRSEHVIGGEGAIAHLAEAIEATEDVRLRAERTRELAGALVSAGRPVEAVEACDRALAALGPGDRELRLRLEVARCHGAAQDPSTGSSVDAFRERFRGRVSGATAAERELLVELALRAAALGTSADEVAETIAPAHGRLVAEQGADAVVVFEAITALTYADRFDDADDLLEQAMADVRARGSLTGYVHISTFRAHNRLRRGLVEEAESDVRGALEAADLEAPPAYVLPGTVAILVEALIERGDVAAAEDELLRSGLPAVIPPLFPLTMLLHSRARLRLAQTRPHEALADAILCGERQDALYISNPALIPWRSTAALAHAALGETEAARRLAAEEVELACAFGAPRASGIALRAAGVVEPGRGGVPLLEDAVEALSQSPARLEYARALVDLGTALRRLGERTRAREPLREGLSLAHECGATALAEHARGELVIAGARPRRDALHGRDALTPSELRIARMAATGLTNREIAQALFVTTKTVETHLHHAFQKLDIEARGDLAAAIDAGLYEPEQARASKKSGTHP
jgi:DNA-binding CsgD family transcriptional regulator